MELRVLAIGRKSVIRRVTHSLAGTGIEVISQTDISEAITLLRKEKFDLALLDGYMDNLESACYRITWQCRLPVALIINGTSADWNILRSLDVDGFIPEEAGNMELVAYFNSIASRKHYQPAQPRILVIEDDEQTQEALQLAFQFYWPETHLSSAFTGNEGLMLARNGTWDVVLLDLKLPDIYGHDVLCKLRSFSQVPVIILTATRNQDEVIKCIKSGANDFIIKPFKQLELLSRIRQIATLGAAVSQV